MTEEKSEKTYAPGRATKTITISMFTSDVQEMDVMVERLKARGARRASRSALIRWALRELEVEDIPVGI